MKTAYIFSGQKLVGLQDVSDYTLADIEKLETAVQGNNRHMAITDKGRAVCVYCQADLGEREIPAGEISHGCCPECDPLK